ncbi:MAG: hypothetical protein Q8M02_00745 [Candidatus Didemnitutus sp.]|nr:hypothetical protein [Candidatus Didemnitutus sp.]
MESLEGIWQPLYAELDGEEAPTEVLQQTEVELCDGGYFVRFGGVTSDQGTYQNEEGNLTLLGTNGPNAGRTIPCRFKFIKDTLMICYGLDGTRPTEFKTRLDAHRYLVTYRRKLE